VASFIAAAVVALAIAFIPALTAVAPFSWFFGAGIGALLYFLLADRHRQYADVSGEPIAVASVH
jgi:NCS1 family nucleobase:cation symporter-1